MAQYPDPASYWDERYSAQSRVWSGEPNAALVSALTDREPGYALDLGCGEGADSIWLAERGWIVTAADVSAVALQRGAEEAARRQLPVGAINWQHVELSEWEPRGEYDLVAASYLHLPSALTRYSMLRRYAGYVRPGGLLFVLSHATFPADRELPEQLRDLDHPPSSELSRLRLEPAEWDVVTCVRYPRGTDDSGQAGNKILWDNLLVLCRLSAVA